MGPKALSVVVLADEEGGGMEMLSSDNRDELILTT